MNVPDKCSICGGFYGPEALVVTKEEDVLAAVCENCLAKKESVVEIREQERMVVIRF